MRSPWRTRLPSALGLTLTIADAAQGVRRDFGIRRPVPSRTRALCCATSGAPGPARRRTSVDAAPRHAWPRAEERSGTSSQNRPPRPQQGACDPVTPPTVWPTSILVDWDACVNLGGTSNSLFAGFALRRCSAARRRGRAGHAVVSGERPHRGRHPRQRAQYRPPRSSTRAGPPPT